MTASHVGVDAEEPVTNDTGTPSTTPAPGDAEQPTTTHAAFGEGRPRLIFKVGADWDGTPPREFDLLEGTTRIGSRDDMDLQLEGLEPFSAEIVHNEEDEYVLNRVTSDDGQSAPVLDVAATEETNAPGPGVDSEGVSVLRTGAPVILGSWQLSYYREEFADHGRPFGGREGGEGSHQAGQAGKPRAND